MAVPPSSSSVLYGFTYDVFLSFRGKDTHFDFTSNLYKALCDSGIHAFIDGTELQEVDEITPSLVKAIEESGIAIVVLSINYASSSFCLDELVTVIECYKAKGRLVLPVFYDIDPSHVRHQIGSYGEAIAEHEKRFQYNKEKYIDNMERLQKWKDALHQVANLSGFHFKNGDEFELTFIQRIVEQVSRKINRAPLHVADYPVGLESRLKEVCSLLELQSDGVLIAGMHGVDGIGKTTLARAVFNNIVDQFEGQCFLHNVRESSVKPGLQHLQEELLFKTIGLNIKLGDVSEGILIIKQRLHRKKVLLILDDVDTLEQLEALVGGCDWFGFGSKVIITTQDKHLLTFHGVETTYEVQELNHRDALQLLCHRVFKQADVDPSYEELLNRVVTYASGLPLALEVVGSNLIGKIKEEWKSTLDRYERIPQKEIQKILKISFDALAEDEQSVFLDIACCFKGYELTEVQDILCAHYGHNINSHIRVLIEKSLISISLDGKVRLHPLIEGMGKEIVRQESPIDPGKRSRLWNPKDIVHVLEENMGSGQIKIIHPDSPLSEVKEWDGKAFKKMKNLKIRIDRVGHFSKGPTHPSKQTKHCMCESQMSFRDPEVPPISQGVTEISQSVPPPQTLDIVPYVSPNSQNVPEVLQTSQRVTRAMLQISQGALQILPGTTWRPVGLQQTYQRVARVMLWTSRSVFQADLTWRLVGLMSNVVGLPCYALSPSFKCVIGGWNSFKLILYGVFCLVIQTTICFGKQSSLFNRHPWLKSFVKFVVFMFISVYSTRYDKCLDGKPEILSMVSNAAFALVSLSLSKLNEFGCEKGIFSYFLGCFATQLYTIHLKLIFVVIFFGFPLFVMHSSSDSQPEADHGGQVNDSSFDSRPEVGGGD